MRAFIVLLSLISVFGCSRAVSVEKDELAPDFTLSSIEGATISLSDYRDKKPVLAVFWATWCPFCVEEILVLNKISGEYENLVVLGINIKESLEKVSGFARTKWMNYTILLDSTGSVAQDYGVRGIPTNVLIDKDGKILYKGHSIEECERIIMNYE